MPQIHLTQAMVQAFVTPEDEEVADNGQYIEENIIATYQRIPDEYSEDESKHKRIFFMLHKQVLAALGNLTVQDPHPMHSRPVECSWEAWVK